MNMPGIGISGTFPDLNLSEQEPARFMFQEDHHQMVLTAQVTE